MKYVVNFYFKSVTIYGSSKLHTNMCYLVKTGQKLDADFAVKDYIAFEK